MIALSKKTLKKLKKLGFQIQNSKLQMKSKMQRLFKLTFYRTTIRLIGKVQNKKIIIHLQWRNVHLVRQAKNLESIWLTTSTMQLAQEMASQKSHNRIYSNIEEVDQATKQSDSSNSCITNLFNQIDTQINNQLLITPHKNTICAENKINLKGSTPLLSSHSREDPTAVFLKLQQINEDAFQKSQRTRTNKNKLLVSEDKNQLSQYKRHQSLNISKPRKSIILDNSVLAISHKRKSEVVSVKRSKSIDEQRQDQQMKEFEKDWEKKNGVKLYMLNYQKRKEIKQLFLNQEKDKVNIF
ncbi:hypothetical protein TTHERM_01013140 (macronuclear) [Tetrahymena thermophila SB210]|uniref:Uncharacterized protein n=1 Tax=Tetrahymena thermophila (strain SB210) TaxID=312017 RepID=Q22L39_TETTS|nr:hypothetical protein TTHERM_01013140 [Tetrahymena thermophila SB210]EAR85978.2 hypothetical protein TTHERM_01013140 [Tetrahymena thermophila SB210]|eukprot:XP_976573.2 hypothetical protein TTHERM_01013140 [Tetrahymena thermophila SB210]